MPTRLLDDECARVVALMNDTWRIPFGPRVTNQDHLVVWPLLLTIGERGSTLPSRRYEPGANRFRYLSSTSFWLTSCAVDTSV